MSAPSALAAREHHKVYHTARHLPCWIVVFLSARKATVRPVRMLRPAGALSPYGCDQGLGRQTEKLHLVISNGAASPALTSHLASEHGEQRLLVGNTSH